MKKFEELSDAAQLAAIHVLSQVIIRSEGAAGIDRGKLEWQAHAIREAFATLEGKIPSFSGKEPY